ncbi:MAG: hypothetical protein ACK4WB_00970 [Desulfatiglandales bacterium]
MAEWDENWKDKVIARIQNRLKWDQWVDLVYLPSMNAFITDGIWECFNVKEIMIPAYMVVKDLELVGAILSTLLEDMSKSLERGVEYKILEGFELFGKRYLLNERPLYFELEEAEVEISL